MTSINTKYNFRNKRMNLKKNKDTDSESETESEELFSDSETESETNNKQKIKKNRRRVIEDESSETGSSETIYETEDDDVSGSDSEASEYNQAELRRTLSQIFPSKYMSKKVRDDESEDEKYHKTKSLKRHDKHATDKHATDKKNTKEKKHKKERKEKKRHSHHKKKSSKYDDSDSESDEDYTSEDAENDKNINIILTIDGDNMDGDNYFDENDDDCELNEDEDEDCDSDDEKMFMKEKYEAIEGVPEEPPSPTNSSVDAENKKSSESRGKKIKNSKKHKLVEETPDLTDVEQEYIDLIDLKKQLMEKLNKRPKNKILIHAVEECKDAIHKLVKKARSKNVKQYHKLVHRDRQKTNEMDYFKMKMSNKEQLKIMNDLKEINQHIHIEKPYRLALLESKIPAKFKAIALQKLNILRSMEQGDPEYYKIKNWVDTFMRVPFCIYKSLSVNMTDGLDACHSFMQNAKNTLDECTYGLDNAKLQILQMVGQWISNPSAMGTAIAIKGPMGTGKTTLVKEGISKILGREFAFIALGGAGDSSFLEGHSYTYEGSSWGKIVQILIDSKCMNPVIYFDELDKISDTPRGEEIIGILTHLTDTSQNSEFHDKYFSDIHFDLSKCLFIFSYNDESKVNSILKDRMYRIQTKGYDSKEKVNIARNYLLPKIREQVNFTETDIIIPDDTIQYIVSNSFLTKNEDGVRNLKRCLEIIHTKLNLFRLIKPDQNIFEKDIGMEVSFPMTVTRKHVDILIKNEETQNQSILAMYI